MPCAYRLERRSFFIKLNLPPLSSGFQYCCIAATISVGAGWRRMNLGKSDRSRGGITPPSKLLAVTELPRALADAGLFAAWLPKLLAFSPRGDGHPVLVVPGMLAGDLSTAPLRGALESLGYDVLGWGLGRNLGSPAAGAHGEHLLALIDRIHARTGKRVSIIGWRLGGILARIAARRRPAKIRQVITLGAPFGSNPKATNAWPVYEAVSGTRLHDPAPQAIGAKAEAIKAEPAK